MSTVCKATTTPSILIAAATAMALNESLRLVIVRGSLWGVNHTFGLTC